MIRALLFDFDGTIIDTEICDYEAWRQVFLSYGFDLPLADWVPGFHGATDKFDPYAELEARAGRPLAHKTIRHLYQAREAECIEAKPLMPGVAEYLAAAEQRNIKVAVVSSETRGWIVGHLNRFGLAHRFDAICCADDTPNLKPNPDLYLLALARLGVEAHEAVALEDSPNGITAAKRAGLFCVAVPNPVTRLLDLSQADLIVESLAELSLDHLNETMKGSVHAG